MFNPKLDLGMESKIDLSLLSEAEKTALLSSLEAEKKSKASEKRKAYEDLRGVFMKEVLSRLQTVHRETRSFKSWLSEETEAFGRVMKEYGAVRSDDQMNFTIVDGDFKLEVKSNKVKGFDERADLAADRLIDYLKRYMSKSEKGADDPMYQMAMTLLERNKVGDLDYKSISKLYELEEKFDAEYGEIMSLFKEANVVQRNAVNYYFWERNDNGVWVRIEPSFCRM